MTKARKAESVIEAGNEQKSNQPPEKKARQIELPESMSVRQLSELLETGSIDIIKQLMRNGVMANINQVVSYDVAAAIAGAYGFEARLMSRAARKAAIARSRKQAAPGEDGGNLQPRPPVVTVMGHVDHGKTRLLDTIRKTNVMDTEAGQITQHIGAYQAEVNGQKITFLDTPGHEAFTAMRAHGAQITDITILVVAADDGVMPQTMEAIDHARAADVPIVVALNKIDKANANPDNVKQQLADAGLVIEEWGGDTICVPISAKEGTGVTDLLENLVVVAEVEDLKANPSQAATGVVIEAEMDKTRGALATVLVQNGTLKPGDTIVVGTTWGRVRAMYNDTGKQVKRAGPATPVVVLGLSSVPEAGEILTAVPDERRAQAMVQQHQAERQAAPSAGAVSLNNLYDQISAGRVKELSVIIKADVQGSIEPIQSSLEQLGSEEVKVRVIHSGTGNVTESDVMLAIASRGLIIGFGVDTEAGAKRLAAAEKVDIRHYSVIYNLAEDVNKALKGMLEPTFAEVIDGRAEVRAVFPAGKGKNVVGAYITDGKASRNAKVRIRRREEVLSESAVSSLKRFKDNVREVATGYECGIGVADFNDFQVGDTLEFFRLEETSR